LLKVTRGIETIVHLAAITHTNRQALYWQINTEGTRNLVNAAKINGVRRIILLSTRAIGPNSGPYGKSKLAAEEIVKNSELNWIILRLAEVYGLGSGMIDRYINLVRKSYFVPIINIDKYPLAPIYIDDVINILKKIVLKSNLNRKIYTLVGPNNYNLEELTDQICKAFKLTRHKIYLPLKLLKAFIYIIGLIPNQRFFYNDQIARFLSPKSADISMVRSDLNFNPISFYKALISNEGKNTNRS